MNPRTQSKNATILPVLIALTLGCFGLSQTAQAVCQAGCGFSSIRNTFLGEDALIDNISGINNTATGAFALRDNTAGANNTATGAFALRYNTTGINNTAIGFDALETNTTGHENTAVGLEALWNNTTGNNNTAIGFDALVSNTTGNNNTASGAAALEFNTTGNDNTAIGLGALNGNTTGHSNIALGLNAGQNVITGSNNIDIGNAGATSDRGVMRIGTVGTHNATIIAGISGVTVPDGVGVIVGTNGKLGTVVSSERFKDGIKPMDNASEAILALKPVTFRYKHELDPAGIPQFGLVAEEVEKVNPDLVARDEQGKPYTVRYEAVNAMLLNEFLKEHRKGEQQDRKIGELEATVAKLQSVLKEQAAQIQKVTAQVEVSSSVRAPQMVNNK